MASSDDAAQLARDTRICGLIRASLRLLCVIFNIFLFVYCFVKARYRARGNTRKHRMSCLKFFGVMDIQLIFMSFYDFFGSCFYLVLFSKDFCVLHNQDDELTDYDIVWVFFQVFTEIGCVITHINLAIYSIVVMLTSLKTRQLLCPSVDERHSWKVSASKTAVSNHCCMRPNSRCRRKIRILKDNTIKKIFICVQTLLPLIIATIPISTGGYEYSSVSPWPFISNRNYYTLTCFYLYVILAEATVFVQMVTIIYVLITMLRYFMQTLGWMRSQIASLEVIEMKEEQMHFQSSRDWSSNNNNNNNNNNSNASCNNALMVAAANAIIGPASSSPGSPTSGATTISNNIVSPAAANTQLVGYTGVTANICVFDGDTYYENASTAHIAIPSVEKKNYANLSNGQTLRNNICAQSTTKSEAIMFYNKVRKQKNMFLSATLKNFGFSLYYIIAWTTSLIARLISFIHNDEISAGTYVIKKSVKIAFAVGGPSLSFLNAIFYFTRLGAAIHTGNKKCDDSVFPKLSPKSKRIISGRRDAIQCNEVLNGDCCKVCNANNGINNIGANVKSDNIDGINTETDNNNNNGNCNALRNIVNNSKKSKNVGSINIHANLVSSTNQQHSLAANGNERQNRASGIVSDGLQSSDISETDSIIQSKCSVVTNQTKDTHIASVAEKDFDVNGTNTISTTNLSFMEASNLMFDNELKGKTVQIAKTNNNKLPPVLLNTLNEDIICNSISSSINPVELEKDMNSKLNSSGCRIERSSSVDQVSSICNSQEDQSQNQNHDNNADNDSDDNYSDDDYSSDMFGGNSVVKVS